MSKEQTAELASMKRYWISWVQNTRDFRPLTDPPGANVLGWWKSGQFDDGTPTIDLTKAILCAVVEAKNEGDAYKVIKVNWEANVGEIGGVRFCTEQLLDWRPGNRFPITEEWEKERFGLTTDDGEGE